MRALATVLWAFLALIQPSQNPDDHLVPDADALAEPNDFKSKLRHVFAGAFSDDVPIRAVIVPSFMRESAIGLRVTAGEIYDPGGFEAYILEASDSVWDSHLLEIYEAERAEHRRTGAKDPYAGEEIYQDLKKSAASDYRQIKADRHAREIPWELGVQITSIWESALLDVRHPAGNLGGADGTSYYFSGFYQGRGTLSGHAWSPDPDTRNGRLVALLESMGKFARGDADLAELKQAVQQASDPVPRNNQNDR